MSIGEVKVAMMDYELSSDFTYSETDDGPARLQHEGQPLRLPKTGEFLLSLFLTKRERIYVIGDLAEEYQRIYSAVGRRSARFWFYQQVLGSLLPLTLRSLSMVGIPVPFLQLVRRLGR